MGVRRRGGELAFPWRGGGLRRPHFFLRRKKCGKESRLDLRSKNPLARCGSCKIGGADLAELVRWVTLLSVQGSLVPLAPLPLTTARVGAGTLVVFGDYQIAPIAARSTAMGRCARWAQDIIACDAAERIIFAVVAGSGSGKLCRHSPFIRQRRQKAMPARRCGKLQPTVAREGFLDRRSKRCFWLLLSPQTKVARAGARNSSCAGCGRDEGAYAAAAATPHPPPSGAPVSLRVGRFAGLTRHRRVIQRREPLKGKADGGVSFNTTTHQGGMLGGAAVGAKNVYRGWGKRPRQPPRR